jgi:hypothetical protein
MKLSKPPQTAPQAASRSAALAPVFIIGALFVALMLYGFFGS